MNPAPPVTITGTRLIAFLPCRSWFRTVVLNRLQTWAALLRLEFVQPEANIKYLPRLIDANNH